MRILLIFFCSRRASRTAPRISRRNCALAYSSNIIPALRLSMCSVLCTKVSVVVAVSDKFLDPVAMQNWRTACSCCVSARKCTRLDCGRLNGAVPPVEFWQNDRSVCCSDSRSASTLSIPVCFATGDEVANGESMAARRRGFNRCNTSS